MNRNVLNTITVTTVTVLFSLILGACSLTSLHNGDPSQFSAAEVTPCCGPVTQDGRRILALLNESNVEHLWLNHRHVNWETGEPDQPADYVGPESKSHCSAFTAAISKRLEVYMLRPPEHSQNLLASAQTRWFRSAGGKDAGWYSVKGAEQAQILANKGKLVIIAYESPDPHTPGHIAIVRPSLISVDTLRENGPEITQAGAQNYLSGYARSGFKRHPGAWPDGVEYFAHEVLPKS